jgi:phosphatidate cytidylyltransferase
VNLSDPMQLVLGGILVLLVVATATIALLRRLRPQLDVFELAARVRSWWIMAAIFTVALLLTRTISLVFFTFVSFLAFKEYLSVVPTRRADRRVLFWAYLAIPIQYLWIGYEWYGMFIVWIPVYAFLLLPLRMVMIGETRGFLRAAGTLHWGLMTTVFSISHVAFLLVLPDDGSGPSLVLYLIVLTQLNDVAQYIWGRWFGERRAVPTVSPNKTVAGFVGGVLTTLVLAYVLGPVLTPLTRWERLAAGLMIGVGGFIGDIVISSMKRDLKIKDAGSLIPGHGGILDRLDSLTYTAPLFFHFVRYFHF